MDNNFFNPKKTGMSMYDDVLNDWEYGLRKNRLGKVVQMTPEEYISEAAKIFSTHGRIVTPEELIRQRTDSDLVRLKEILPQGNIDMPMLNYGPSGYATQEGLHRAIAAKQLGATKIPVAIFQTGPDYGDSTPTLKKLLKRITKFSPYALKGLGTLGIIASQLSPVGLAYDVTEGLSSPTATDQQMWDDVNRYNLQRGVNLLYGGISNGR